MTVRVWHGRTLPDKGEAYLKFLLGRGTEGYRATSGNLSIKVWLDKQPDAYHFYAVTEWIDLESVKRFAGEDFRLAQYYPEDVGILLEFEKTVAHYECFNISNALIRRLIQRLNSLFSGGSWQRKSWLENLDGLDAEVAFHEPRPGIPCIAELVGRCLYWRAAAIRHLQGDEDFRNLAVDKMNFQSRERLRETGWEAVIKQFKDRQSDLISLLKDKTDNFLDEKYESDHSYGLLLEGIIEHDIYHLGQIELLRRMYLMNTEQSQC